MNALKYLAGYSENTLQQVRSLIAREQLGDVLLRRYSGTHAVTSDKALYGYVMDVKNTWLRNAEPISKVLFDNKIQIVQHALGLHTAISRVQGGKLKAKREIRVAPLFKALPLPFLNMIVAHELAHLREREHNKAFYQLCCAMQPDYHQVEFDLRLYLTYLDLYKTPLWQESV
jgi:predicted metal-dependent hydrolase